MHDNIKNRITASFLLYAIGDIIGFKNSDWKLDYGKPADIGTINEFVYEFIDLGGINGIDISDWIISADSIYHIAIAEGLSSYNDKTNKNKLSKKIIVDVKNAIINAIRRISLDSKNGIFRYEGNTTIKQALKFTIDHDARQDKYTELSAGNGVASRSIPIGIMLNKESELNKLIETSITLGSLTHNSPLGYLPGFTVSYFASLALQGVEIYKWPQMMLNILESEQITKHIDISDSQLNFSYMDYVRYWKKYVDTRFIDDKPIKTRSTSNLIFRTKYYYENFVKGTRAGGIGVSGFAAAIIAYDALLDCDGIWEKVVFYAILNPSDSNTVGAICGGLFGLVYGFGDVPEHMLTNIEEKDKLTELSKLYYKKFK